MNSHPCLFKLLFCFHIIFLSINAGAQSESALLKLAREHFKKEDYPTANKYYKESWNKLQNESDELKQAGFCAYQANDPEFASRCYEKILAMDNYNLEAHFNLAKSKQALYEFQDAIVHYKKFYRLTDKNDTRKAFVKNELLRCEEAQKIKRRLSLALVEPPGTMINSAADEFAAIPDPMHPGDYLFSAIRKENSGGLRNDAGISDPDHGRLRADIYNMHQQNGQWIMQSLPLVSVNSTMEDIPLGFSENGSILIFSRSWSQQQTSIMVDSNQKSVKLNYPSFISPMNPGIGDHALCIYQDSLLIFSSKRLGGFGGYDLYLSKKKKGRWQREINLGPDINTAFNEDYPYLAKDGLTLYFSSDNLKSMGGFDIFKTAFLPEAKQWTIPLNLGIPINSSDDDLNFKLSSDGLAGIFNSNRKLNNSGGHDIYFAFFKDGIADELKNSVESPLMDYGDLQLNENDNSTKIVTTQVKKTEIKKVFQVEALYYNEQELLNSKNLIQLDKLTIYLKQNPTAILKIIAHAYEESADPINLYFSIKKAEEVKQYFKEQLIPSGKIQVYGVGASFPIAQQIINRNISRVSIKFNRRIEFEITHADTSTMRLTYQDPMVPASVKLNEYKGFTDQRKELSYSIFLGASASVLNHPLISNSEIISYVLKKDSTGEYYYYSGIYKAFKDAIQASASTKENLIIKAFVGGDEIPRTEIINYVQHFPDLLLYLNYLKSKE